MPGELRDLLERVAGDDLHDVGQPGAADVVGQLLRAHRVVLDRHELAARLAQPHAHPDRAVAARAADLERALRAARRDHARRRNRPSSSETASCPLSFALMSASSFVHVGRLRAGAARSISARCCNDRPCARSVRSSSSSTSYLIRITTLESADPSTRTRRCRRYIAAAAAAARRASATQSGMPTARKPLPATKSPPMRARAALDLARPGRSCPTLCCAPASRQR